LEKKIHTFPSNQKHGAVLFFSSSRKAPIQLKEKTMNQAKTVIVTGASQGIGEAVVRQFLARGYNVVATSRRIAETNPFGSSAQLAVVQGDIGEAATAQRVANTAIEKFGRIDALVNNAGIFIAKPFTDYTTEDFAALTSTNLYGFLHLTQLAVKQMQKQGNGGSVVGITTSLVDHPIAGLPASVAMITKGGLDAAMRSLAIEYAAAGIRFNNVAPGIVDTPMHKDNPKDFLRTLSPMSRSADASEIADAALYLTEAKSVTGEVLHVDGGSHGGKW
jgi:NAD(P)-dependent dehydrogenase (short-subunit alcohol dehydrogenase family)